MQILETRPDGSVLCVLSAEEASTLEGRPLQDRKWFVKGYTGLRGVYASRKVFEFIIHAPTRERAEEMGRARIMRRSGTDLYLIDIGAQDVTGKTQGFFGGWS